MSEIMSGNLTGFAEMMRSMATEGDQFSITLPEDWLQGRTAYGGLSAAVCLEATRRAFRQLPPLRSAQFSFIGPATGNLQVLPKLLRQGKSAAFVGVDLEGEAGLAVRATLCFGSERGSPHGYDKLAMPSVLPPDHCPPFYVWSPRPNFMAHFDGRLAGGSGPVTGGSPEMLVWLRHRDEAVPLSIVSLLALADALPPASFGQFSDVVPISTMTWSIDLLDAVPGSETGWWLVNGVAETIREGYSAQTTVIWNPAGRPILAARQNVAIFDKRQL